ncbi:MAG TPA: acyl-CoA dehydratase activase [Thermodesulfobacteriota bacterium]|nr:acyl-CoA dehydratase activase [Thermodesulfobacteriota bacterium]HNU71142.1 acyl-CoA dehydratase activase [Thermodesulfobacteriota bacterium]HQO79315.1 acyl-CoA dehydratase activase [Thermodesulfobacteriota bacterium]
MVTAGLDIGSRTIALVEWDGESIVREEVAYTGTDPVVNAQRLINGSSYDRVVATGYGRHLAVERRLTGEVITEIKAYAIGARHLYPDVRTVLDIGGQDSKVIFLKPDGGVARFEMNDRCAAGTGRFLENMALALGLSIDQIGGHALAAQGNAVRLSSMCAVFAESEVVSLIGRGEDSHRVALGIHQAIVDRVSAMVRRIGLQPAFMFAGGVARNQCMRHILSQDLTMAVTVPENPQTVGALGAALYAAQRLR